MELVKDLSFILLPKPADHVPGALSKWVPNLSKSRVSLCLYAAYFLLIGGVVYDLQYQPQGMGQYVDKLTVSLDYLYDLSDCQPEIVKTQLQAGFSSLNILVHIPECLTVHSNAILVH